MTSRMIIGLMFVSLIAMNGCKSGCVTCTGPTAAQKICRDDFSEKSDYEKYISEYQELENGICEE